MRRTIDPPRDFEESTGTVVNGRWGSGMPLGGIGTGKIEVLTDGSFGNFTINHNWDRPFVQAPAALGAFAAVWARPQNGTAVVRMLRLVQPGEYQGVQNVAGSRASFWFPHGWVSYQDPALPIRVALEAWSPLIPHDVADSCLPVACLTYELSNPTGQPVDASVLLSWPNILGWGGRRDVDWSDESQNHQTPFESGSQAGLRYTTNLSYTDQRQNVVGQYLLAARLDPGISVSTCSSWDVASKSPAFWASFAQQGTLADAPAVTAPSEPAGAICARVRLPPGEKRRIGLMFVWFMPHMITVQRQVTYGSKLDQSHVGLDALFDGDPATRWSTGRAMQAGDNLTLDLGRTVTPASVTLDVGGALTDYPRGYRVQVSPDGGAWTTVAEASAQAVAASIKNGKIRVDLAPAAGRYLRIVNLQPDSFYWWSIYGLQITAAGESAPLALTASAATAYLVHGTEQTHQEDVGHFYLNRFQSPDAIAHYVSENRKRLRAGTLYWQQAVRASSLPLWLQLKLINDAFPLVTNTVLTKDGRFVVQESPVDMWGSTGTMDQRMAAHALYTAFFPALDRDELTIFAECQQPDGRITHFDGNIHEVIGSPDVNYGITDWPDLSCSWILQVCKLYRWTGDREFLDRMWPHVKAAVGWLESADRDGDGIPEGGSTYDYEQPSPGAFIYTASCYLGALEAGIDMATVEGDTTSASHYQALLDRARQSTLSLLWNGRWFRKWYSPTTGKSNENSFVACLAGDWLARLAGLPRTLPAAVIHTAVQSTVDRHQRAFFPVPSMEVRPDGSSATGACYLLQDEAYLGCEAIYERLTADGLETLKRVYDCAWLINASPWNESLGYSCPDGVQGGLHSYMTASASWHVLEALAGASLDLPAQTLTVSPRRPPGQGELAIPLFFPRFTAWFDYAPARKRCTLRILATYRDTGSSGPIVLRSVRSDGDSPTVPLPRPFIVKPGAVLNLWGATNAGSERGGVAGPAAAGREPAEQR